MNIFVIKRTALQLLSEFIGRQKIRLVGVGVTKLRGNRREADTYYRFAITALS